MATLLESSLLENIAPILSLLFVMAVVFGIFSVTKLFGDNRGIHILIAFILGIMVLLVPGINSLIVTMMPWFTFLFIFIVFMLLAYKIFGATDADIVGVLKADRTIGWLILIVCVIIAAGSMAKVYGQQLLPITTAPAEGVEAGATPIATGAFGSNLAATLFHPKILGFGLIMIIAVFAMAILAMKPE